jgi:hypothetical protein
VLHLVLPGLPGSQRTRTLRRRRPRAPAAGRSDGPVGAPLRAAGQRVWPVPLAVLERFRCDRRGPHDASDSSNHGISLLARDVSIFGTWTAPIATDALQKGSIGSYRRDCCRGERRGGTDAHHARLASSLSGRSKLRASGLRSCCRRTRRIGFLAGPATRRIATSFTLPLPWHG